MARKTVSYNQGGAAKLPNDKPAVYRIQTEGGKTNYVGVAKRGRVAGDHQLPERSSGEEVRLRVRGLRF